MLSACETHARAATNGEGVFALPWGFFFAGARSVIATRWRVDDAAAAEFMVELYRRVGGGENPTAALSAARRFVARARPDPYYWPPFVMLGCRFD